MRAAKDGAKRAAVCASRGDADDVDPRARCRGRMRKGRTGGWYGVVWCGRRGATRGDGRSHTIRGGGRRAASDDDGLRAARPNDPLARFHYVCSGNCPSIRSHEPNIQPISLYTHTQQRGKKHCVATPTKNRPKRNNISASHLLLFHAAGFLAIIYFARNSLARLNLAGFFFVSGQQSSIKRARSANPTVGAERQTTCVSKKK